MSLGVIKMCNKLYELRKDKDVKQEVVAKILDVSQTTYSRYESGELEISNTALKKLAEYFKASIDYILGITEEKTAYKSIGAM
jgi:transcriptional regulator with XRE-family HTH domain